MKTVFPKKPEKMNPAVFLEVYSSFTRPEYGAVVVRSIKRKVSESSERLFFEINSLFADVLYFREASLHSIWQLRWLVISVLKLM